jgi:hypothetical protein
MDEYTIEGHALRRIAQRKIPRHWVQLTIEHGESRENYQRGTLIASISKDKCQELIDELVNTTNELNIEDIQVRKNLELIDSLQELRDRGGIKVIYSPEAKKVITAYHKKETIFADFPIF